MNLKQLKEYTWGLLLILMIGVIQRSNAQICTGCGTITGFPTTTIFRCPGTLYDLTWGWNSGPLVYTFESYSWSPTTGVTAATGTTTGTTSFVVPTTTTTYTLTATGLGPNEILGGNFDGGALPTGFTSSYNHDCATIATQGTYCLCTHPSTYSGFACAYGDVTGVNMMMINGSNSTSTTTTTDFLYTTDAGLRLCCNTTYHLSLFASTWDGVGVTDLSPAIIKIKVNGVIIGICSLTSTCGVWNQYGFDFTTPDCAGSTEYVTQNQFDFETSTSGNDFAIDDIRIQRVCTTTKTITISPLNVITGPTSTCVGSTIQLTGLIGGSWSSSNTLIATVNTTGVVTGLSVGVVTITYNYGSCFSTQTITINPSLPSIGGVLHVCRGNTTTLTNGVSGGSWSSSNIGIATIGSGTGVVTGVNAGTTVITYTTGTCYITCIVTVNPLPLITGIITYPTTICSDKPFTLNAIPACPTCTFNWTGPSLYPPIPPITNPTTVPSGVPFGTSAVYTVTETNSFGCINSRTYTVTPNQVPYAGTIIGPGMPICVGGTYTFTNTTSTSDIITGYTWTSSVPGIFNSVAPVTLTTDVLQAMHCGTVNLTYHRPSAHCGTATTTLNVPIFPTPIVSITSDPPASGDPLTVFDNCGPVKLTAFSNPQHCTGIPSLSMTYTWTPTTDMTGGPFSPTVTVDPLLTTTYSVTASNGYCSSAPAAITVTTVSPTCICDRGVTFNIVGASGFLTTSDITALAAGGNFVINNSVILPVGTLNMNNCVIVMANGVSITVPRSGGKLIISKSHLFCCSPDMWTGIILESGLGIAPSGKIELTNNTLIEDAKVAIDVIANPTTSGYGTTGGTAGLTNNLIIYSHGAIFNKNYIGIRINNDYNIYATGVITSLHPGLPYLIENTVFTCRKFDGYNTSGIAYPFAWPNTNGTVGTGGLKANITPATHYDPPYNLDVAYGTTVCNNPGLGISYMGIDLEMVGVTPTAAIGAETYNNMVVGGASYSSPTTIANDMNLFDNMHYGIYAHNSNVLARNNTFMNMIGTKLDIGIGIYIF